MSAKPAKADKVDAAIAGAGDQAPNVTFEMKLSSGRGAAVLVPVNLSPQEAVDLIGMIARDLPRALVQAALERQGKRLGPRLVDALGLPI